MLQEGNTKMLSDIHKDVSRTLPNHVYFQKKFNHGQKDLFTILKCLSIVEPELGYVQGMGYMAAILLTYVDKEDAFSIMLKIINGEQYKMKEFYKAAMPGLKTSYYVFLVLLKKYMPKLYVHLEQQYFMPPLYATQWFMTLFSSNMPLELTLRIWDIFFIEGQKILYRIGLAIFKINEKEMMHHDNEGCNRILKDYLQESTMQDMTRFKPDKPMTEEEKNN